MLQTTVLKDENNLEMLLQLNQSHITLKSSTIKTLDCFLWETAPSCYAKNLSPELVVS